MKTKTNTKAGGIRTINHNESLRVRSNVKAGGIRTVNRNESLRVCSNVKAGGLKTVNHNEKITRVEQAVKKDDGQKRNRGYGITVMSIRSGIKAGWISRNYK